MPQPNSYDDGLVSHADGQKPAKSDQPRQASTRFWEDQIKRAKDDHREYLQEADKVYAVYRRAEKSRRNTRKRRMNVLYANAETIRGAVFAKPGKPDVQVRWQSQDPEMRSAAEMLENALIVATDNTPYETTVKRVVLDAILAGRGIMRYVYDPVIQEVEQEDEFSGQIALVPQITDQTVRKKRIGRHDFLHSPAEEWGDVWWVAFRHRMTLDELKENNFENPEQIPRNWVPMKDGKPDTHADDNVRRAEVWEIWSKHDRTRRYLVIGHKKFLREEEDPYQLEHFWPMPPPLSLLPATDNVIPSIEWDQYVELSNDLEEVMNRIAHLTRSMRRRGIRDAAIKELAQLAKAGDDQLVPVKNYENLAQKGGLAQAYELEDLRPYATLLTELYRAKAEIEASIDKLSGIADVMRGNVDSQEKLGQTELKAQYGGLRIKTRQREVELWVRDGYAIEAELMVEHFEPHVLSQMSGVEVSEEALGLLRDDRLRSYLIDVESSSTIFEDTEQVKASVNEAVTSTTSLLQVALPVMQTEPEIGEIVFEMMKMVLRSIKGTRALEETIDQAKMARQQRMEAAMQQPQEQPEDPRLQTEQVKAEAAQAKAGADMQKTEMEMERSRLDHAQALERMAAERSAAMVQGPETIQ